MSKMRALSVTICLAAASLALSAPTPSWIPSYPLPRQHDEKIQNEFNQAMAELEKLQSVLGGGKDSAQNQPAPIIFAPVLVLATGQGSQNFKLGGMDRLPQLPLYPPINPQARPEGSVPDRLPAEWIPVPMRNDRETLVEHTEIPLHPGM